MMEQTPAAAFSCFLCPRRCGAPRSPEEGHGRCGMPSLPVVARAALHTGEEPCISGTRGSGTVFFSGCPLRCVYCQNAPISHGRRGQTVTSERLADIFRELCDQGAHNINLVSPTPYVHVIREALERWRPPVPVVYNTGGYESVKTLRLLDGLVDVYLPDLKTVDPELSVRLLGADDYVENATAAILEMARQTGPMTFDPDGIARRGTIVRHLLLPGHTRSSIDTLDWLRAHLPDGVYISLMFQYTPVVPDLPYPELLRRATRRECEKVWDHLLSLGLENGYVQDRASAKRDFIPAFDLTGVQKASSHGKGAV